MKEIGGYFGLEEFANREYYPDLVALNSARNALIYLVRAKKIKKVYIPYLLCDSVAKALDKELCEYEYYHINDKLNPIFNKSLGDGEYLYIVNYYGQLNNERELKQKYKNIIVDNVQAFFRKPVPGIDTIYSCRKFFGVPDGAYLSTGVYIDKLAVDISMERMTHILGRYDSNSATDYYEKFKENEEAFNEIGLKKMSRLTHNLLGAIDYDFARLRREMNFAYLQEQLKALNTLDVAESVGPYAYPFYIKNNDDIRRKLLGRGIYIPTLWPNVLEQCERNTIEYSCAMNILPLPIDQRYGIDEMKYLVENMLACID